MMLTQDEIKILLSKLDLAGYSADPSVIPIKRKLENQLVIPIETGKWTQWTIDVEEEKEEETELNSIVNYQTGGGHDFNLLNATHVTVELTNCAKRE